MNYRDKKNDRLLKLDDEFLFQKIAYPQIYQPLLDIFPKIMQLAYDKSDGVERSKAFSELLGRVTPYAYWIVALKERENALNILNELEDTFAIWAVKADLRELAPALSDVRDKLIIQIRSVAHSRSLSRQPAAPPQT